MELKLIRKYFTEESTIGELYVNNVFQCHILEDKDRGLTSDMELEEIKKIKIKSQTAIPTGTYLIVNSFSPRFKKYLPLLLNVPGYEGVRIHPGNTSADTDGCLLPGSYDPKAENFVRNSKIAFKALYNKLILAEKKEKISLTIEKQEK